jgi:WD40 repeat protein
VAVLQAAGPLALAPDSRFLASARGADPRSSENVAAGEAGRWLRLWDLEQSADQLPLLERKGTAKHLSFSPDGAWLAVTEANATGSRLYSVNVELYTHFRNNKHR